MRNPKTYSGFLKVTEAFGTKREPDFVHTPALVALCTKIQRRRASLRSPGSALISTIATRFPGPRVLFLMFAHSPHGLLCFLQALSLPPTDQRLYLGMGEMATLICLKVWMRVWMDVSLCMLALQWAMGLSRLKPHLFPEDSWDGIQPLPTREKCGAVINKWRHYVGNVSGSSL